ncbi:regulator of G-protein signaling 12-like isoform X1 [Gadus chalcogrammus]|uniref:regulator of G-protein signaling 12-like isoform X1 n=1 Tax=Gadus chalcogrammus TaxID=1042646 RepID=UPI0024C4A54D|nr:regulator of G-protein signaling 12-like isoform X1 [Gadus chalcogrammus]
MRIMGQPEGVRRRLDLELNPPPGDVRHLEVVRGRAGYGFTVTGQGPCLLSAILEGGPGAQVGLKQGDRLMAVNGADVSHLPHETVVQLIGTCCNGPLRLAVLAEGRSPGTPAIDEDECDGKDLYRKAGVFRALSDDPAPPSVCSPGETKPRPVSEPDLSRWAQRLDSLVERPQEEGTEDGDSVCSDPEEAGADWSLLNMTMVVGYLSSTELLLSHVESEESCLEAIRQCIRQLGTEQDTHTLVLMKVMFDCVRLCDDAGAVLAAFPAENLLLGAVCAEDGRFFCLVTTAHVSDVRPPQEGPLRASCHVFFVDPELGCHRDHMAIAGRFGFRCTPDPDAAGCLEFPPAPQEVLHFVSVLYGDMGEAVERIRVRLDAEALPPAAEDEDEDVDEEGRGTGKGGSASSTGDSGIGNASPPEERTERDFPPLAEAPGGSHAGVHLPSCPWDYPADEELAPRGRAQTTPSLHCNPDSQLDEGFPLTESLPGPDALSGFYGGPPPRLEFQFKPPPPPLPPGKKQNFLRGPLRNSQRWFSRQKGPKGHGGAPEPKTTVAANVWPSSVSLAGINANFLPPPMSHINTDGYGLGNPGAMLPPKEDWTKRFLEQSTRHAKEGHNKGPRSWSKGARSSGRRPGQRLSMARSLDDLESAASSDGDYGGGGGVQLQGCCSQSSLTSNGSLPAAAGCHRRLSDQRVASWAACFERLLQDPIGVRYFSEFLKKEFSEENILFWQACEYFSHVPATDKKQLSQRAGEIYDSFLSSKATTPVNIDSQAQLADDVLTSPRPDMFKTQQLQIFNLMKFDSYSRFLKSSLYQECMLAEVEGRALPDPYQIPCSPAPSKHSASSERSGLSTPKKEARKPRTGRSMTEDAQGESADKKRGMFFSWSRNRSFGKGPKKKDIGDVNLDYWGSNGRRESQGSLSSGTSMELTPSCSAGKLETDNRQSVAGWDRAPGPGPQKQCSVTLPDGSCSVVVLRGGATIREVLRDLCHNMAVNMAAVDLFLVGGEKPLVLDQDCMTLSARDIRMEKRTLFRLDLVPINRSVGLKAKPTKPVTEVLRPVVAKYGLHLSDLVAKISGESQPLDLGAPISSLDGLRVVLERADPASGKAESKSKSNSLKGYPPTRSLSATNSSSS